MQKMILALSLVLGIAGCGGEGGDSGITISKQAANQTFVSTSESAPTPQRSLMAVTAVVREDSIEGQVFRLYQAAFDRIPDPGGLANWTTHMKGGMTLEQAAWGFTNSEEFKNLYGVNTTTDQFVTLLYKNVLHRLPDAGGYAGWTAALNNGSWNREQVLIGFSESTENKNNTKQAFNDWFNPPTTVSTCDDVLTPLLGQYIGSNNVWGKGSITDYSQCMTYTTGGNINDINATIEWRWPEGQGNVKAYPSIIYGRKPDMASSGTAALPARLGTLPNLTANVDMTVTATGKYDVAFDMWMSSDPVAKFNNNLTHEIMIWLQSGSGVGNVGTLLETVTLSGAQFDVWVEPNFVAQSGLKPWTMVVFRAKSATTKASIQVKQFTDYMVAKGIATPQTYLADIEFGVEPISGSGKVVLNSYSVQ